MRDKHTTSIVAAAAVLSFLLLAGCRELPGKEAADLQLEQAIGNENEDRSLGDAIKETIDGVAADAQQAVTDSAIQLADQAMADGVQTELSSSAAIGSVTKLTVDNPAGGIKVVAGSGDQLLVKAIITDHEPGPKQNWVDEARIFIKMNGKESQISVHPQSSPKADLWKWVNKETGDSNFTITYEIQVPEQVTAFTLSNNVGSVELRGLSGTFDITDNVGNITLQEAVVTGNSRIVSNTGKIAVDVRGIDKGATLKAKTNVGSISAEIAPELSYTLKASSELGRISGTAQGTQDVNGGGPLIELNSQVGSISVQ